MIAVDRFIAEATGKVFTEADIGKSFVRTRPCRTASELCDWTGVPRSDSLERIERVSQQLVAIHPGGLEFRTNLFLGNTWVLSQEWNDGHWISVEECARQIEQLGQSPFFLWRREEFCFASNVDR